MNKRIFLYFFCNEKEGRDMNPIDFRALVRKEKQAARKLRMARTDQSCNASVVLKSEKEVVRSDKLSSPELHSSTQCIDVPDPSLFPKLDEHRVSLSETPFCPFVPKRICYMPNFLSKDSRLYSSIEKNVVQLIPKDKWKTLKFARRKVAMIDGTCEAMPHWLNDLAEVLVQTGAFERSKKPNHVLINIYKAGEGIMSHTDGPEYFNKTATISLGGPAILKFSPRLKSHEIGLKESNYLCEVLLEEGSIVTFESAAYIDFMHGIDEVYTEKITEKCLNVASSRFCESIIRGECRISLTFRFRHEGN